MGVQQMTRRWRHWRIYWRTNEKIGLFKPKNAPNHRPVKPFTPVRFRQAPLALALEAWLASAYRPRVSSPPGNLSPIPVRFDQRGVVRRAPPRQPADPQRLRTRPQAPPRSLSPGDRRPRLAAVEAHAQLQVDEDFSFGAHHRERLSRGRLTELALGAVLLVPPPLLVKPFLYGATTERRDSAG